MEEIEVEEKTIETGMSGKNVSHAALGNDELAAGVGHDAHYHEEHEEEVHAEVDVTSRELGIGRAIISSPGILKA